MFCNCVVVVGVVEVCDFECVVVFFFCLCFGYFDLGYFWFGIGGLWDMVGVFFGR